MKKIGLVGFALIALTGNAYAFGVAIGGGHATVSARPSVSARPAITPKASPSITAHEPTTTYSFKPAYVPIIAHSPHAKDCNDSNKEACKK